MSLLALARKLSAPSSSTFPAPVAARADAPNNEIEWRENFETRLGASEIRKGLFHSLSPYLTITICTCALSGGAFFYFLTNYAAIDGPRGAKIASSQAAIFESSASYSDQDLTAQTRINDAKTLERLTPSPSSASLVPAALASASSFPSDPPAVARNQEAPAPSSAGRPANAVTETVPVSKTFEASTTGGMPDKAAASPLRNSETRTAALTPPADPPLAETASSGVRDVPDRTPVAKGLSDAGAATPDIHLTNLAPDQENGMLKRASDLMNQNDIAGGRLIYRYLADHGSPRGAFALAESYDAKKWTHHRITGMSPDAGLADAWYHRAAELGSREAAAILHGDKR